jgi:cell division protein FtsW
VSEVDAVQALPADYARSADALLARWDVPLATAVLVLLGLGLVMVASASMSAAAGELGQPLHYLWKQALFLAGGLGLGVFTLAVPTDLWHRAGPLLLLMGVVLLVLVLVPGIGREVNGSMRWIKLGPLNLQPSEPTKLWVAVYLAGYLVRRAEQVRSHAAGFFKPIAVLSLIAVLLLLEPDYGAAVVLFATALGMLFLGGVPFWSFIGWMTAVGAVMGAVVVAAPYRVERLLSFLNPWADPFGSGFQLSQALIAIGRGEWLGVGRGSSVQKLYYLPEAHTDFLYAVLAEELGLVGAATVLGLYGFVVWRAIAIGARAERRGWGFCAYLAYGIGLLIGLQAYVNIGVNVGLLPTKGLTLPLMSYGGSSLLVSCLALGMLLRIDHELRARR